MKAKTKAAKENQSGQRPPLGKVGEGDRFGALVALRVVRGGEHSTWLCLCDCGADCRVRADKLSDGRRSSCGCMNAERSELRRLKFLSKRKGATQADHDAYHRELWKQTGRLYDDDDDGRMGDDSRGIANLIRKDLSFAGILDDGADADMLRPDEGDGGALTRAGYDAAGLT